MAEGQSMTTAEVVEKVMHSEHADFLREAVELVARELMEAEITGDIGAGLGERSTERSTHRNGYRPRPWETRVGEIELMVPRKRSGEAYFPSFLEARRPAEQAIVAVVMETAPRNKARALRSLGRGCRGNCAPKNGLMEPNRRTGLVDRSRRLARLAPEPSFGP